jgi:hypothetical protein
MSDLPVREIVLYKHGVGFFLREGTLDATELALTFRHDEINDVLKSLTVLDRAGGQVLGIHYQTPMDKAARLASSSIRLSDDKSLHDLLRDLRGRQITVSSETTPGTLETIRGRIIGIDQPANEQVVLGNSQNVPLLSILADGGQVRIIALTSLHSFSIEDTQSAHDIEYFLDTSKGEDDRRTVAVRLSPGEHQLIVSYVAPSPTWRVSYRIIAESEKDGQSGKALLQGWGLFDNRLNEDLENVAVTLVAGQPISFIYELYASRIPNRPTVQDQSRIAPGPVEYSGVLEARVGVADADEVARGITGIATRRGWSTDMAKRTQVGMAVPQSASIADYVDAVQPAVQTQDAGEFFQYTVTTPVSVKRGESALVPIIGSEVLYNRELLYNGEKLPDHPVAALRFKNTTGLTLERGPVTVVEDGDYKGEAVIAFTKDQNEVYLPYAVELGVHISERPQHGKEGTGLSIEAAFLVYEEYAVNSVKYLLENTTAKPLSVIIEAPVLFNYELFDTPLPNVENATERRWHVDVPAYGKAEFTQKQRYRTHRREELRNLSYQNLQRFLENRWLDKATFERLSEMLNAREIIQRALAEQAALTTKQKTLYEQQEHLRANLTTLNPTGQEATLRNRILAQLEAVQDQLEAINQRNTELEQEIESSENRIAEIIAELG